MWRVNTANARAGGGEECVCYLDSIRRGMRVRCMGGEGERGNMRWNASGRLKGEGETTNRWKPQPLNNGSQCVGHVCRGVGVDDQDADRRSLCRCGCGGSRHGDSFNGTRTGQERTAAQTEDFGRA